MARTKDQLIAIIARRLRERNRNKLTWIEFTRLLNGIAVPQRELILKALTAGRHQAVGTLLSRELGKKELNDASIDAAAILDDDCADLNELDRFL